MGLSIHKASVFVGVVLYRTRLLINVETGSCIHGDIVFNGSLCSRLYGSTVSCMLCEWEHLHTPAGFNSISALIIER